MRRQLFFLLLAAIINWPAFCRDFSEKEITVRATDGVAMGATLTLPDDEPKAAVILATGSGIQNRDEEIFGKKPFRTISEFLSANGYAVLRMDDRGFSNPDDAKNATLQSDVDDIIAGIQVLDSILPEVPKGIIGHSSGGTCAVRIGARNSGIRFIITLAGPAWSGDSVSMSQNRVLAVSMTGRWEGENLQRQILSVAQSDTPDMTARIIITMALNDALGEMSKQSKAQEQIQQQVSAILSPWFRSMLRYDPADDIKALKIPCLALNGSKDIQVLPQNLITMKELNPDIETKILENHNHLFQQCTTGMPQEYATLSGDVSDATLQTILQWLERTIR